MKLSEIPGTQGVSLVALVVVFASGALGASCSDYALDSCPPVEMDWSGLRFSASGYEPDKSPDLPSPTLSMAAEIRPRRVLFVNK